MTHHLTLAAAAALGAACAAVALTQEADGPGPEYGDVAWGRDLDAALTRSSTSKKPVMLLFQEVPG